ncbi:PQQ-dependent sugar dehydrogenase [Gaetbulibacter sp. M240]|uniref:PQQ-dependent sugar dehydrogenase n=1 Tax=Gaetbulibacter sp. M240 TaxID=3126511 RepID=UPI00374EC4BD
MKLRYFALLIFLLSAITTNSQDFSKMKVKDLYENLCMSCHTSGAVGGSLVNRTWKQGSSDAEILKSIKNGYPQQGMVAFGSVISDAQLQALVVYIRELESQEVKKNITEVEPNRIIKTQQESFKVEVLTTGLKTPWGLTFLPDGRKLITERLGPLRIINTDNTLDPTPVKGTPEVIFDRPEGGMMDIALHPDYKKNGWIYLAFADGWRDENGKSWSQTAIVRGRIKDHTWIDQEWIYKADKKFYMKSGAHYGSRIAFYKGYIYFAIGERGSMGQAQDLSRPNGKIFRLYDDGRVPKDNPFIGDPNIPGGIWSYGHRNPQGLVVDKKHRLWATEHGARGGDEFNIIHKGRNYGWPVITHGINYNGQPITSITEKEGMEQPVLHWTPSIAPCGLTLYDGRKFPNWKNDFFTGSLRAEELHRLRVKNNKVINEEIILKGLGRIRDVRTGPDGYIYLLTNDPGRLLRLVNKKN